MIVSARDCWKKAKAAHAIYFDKNVQAARDCNRALLPMNVYDFLLKNHDRIRDGEEADFRVLQSEYEILVQPYSIKWKTRIHSVLTCVFDYASFAEKRKRRWCAYKLCETSELATCPYCNLSYEVTIIIDGVGKIRPALDHFLDKSRYPMFAISLGNLVPSCHHCNSTFKGGSDFLSNPHLNPLTCDEGIQVLLDVDQLDARYDLRKLETSNIKLAYDASDLRKTNSVVTFNIAQRYQSLVCETRTIARHMMEFSLSGANDPTRKSWVLRGVTPANYKNKIFGKMILDLSAVYM